MARISNVSLSLLLASTCFYSTALLASKNTAENKNTGKVLFENNCLVCHKPHGKGRGKGHSKDQAEGQSEEKPNNCGSDHANKSGSDRPKRLAPPMPMVKKHYQRTYPEREEFVEKVAAWIAAPNADAALLHHAVERFGLMPPLGINKETRQQIAGYIYDEIPAGQCKKQHKGGKHNQH